MPWLSAWNLYSSRTRAHPTHFSLTSLLIEFCLSDGIYWHSIIFFCDLIARALVPIATASFMPFQLLWCACQITDPFLTILMAHPTPISPSYDMLQGVISELVPHITYWDLKHITSIPSLFVQSQRFLKVLETKILCILKRWYPQQYI